MIVNLNNETMDSQTFTDFRNAVETEKEKQEEFEKLKQQEKLLNNEIKRLVEDLKKKQDEYAKEA
jgi:hypothetical protein